MIRTSIDFHNRVDRGEIPTPYIAVTTPAGVRLYAEKELSDSLEYGGALLDGSFSLDGTVTLGESEISLSKNPSITSFGRVTKEIVPIDNDFLSAYTRKRGQRINVMLNNGDRSITEIMGKEPFIGQELQLKIGFQDDSYLDHLTLFSGIISKVNVDVGNVKIEAQETQ